MRTYIDVTKDPWRLGAAFLAGLPVPDGSEHPRSTARRAAHIILVENRIRRSRDEPVIDYKTVYRK